MNEALLTALYQLTKPNDAEILMVGLTCLSIILSGIAIFCAMIVPKKIADRQDKIALFEKRYELYSILSDTIEKVLLCEYAGNLNDLDTKDKEEHEFTLKMKAMVFNDIISDETDQVYDHFDMELVKLSTKIKFLFDGINVIVITGFLISIHNIRTIDRTNTQQVKSSCKHLLYTYGNRRDTHCDSASLYDTYLVFYELAVKECEKMKDQIKL